MIKPKIKTLLSKGDTELTLTTIDIGPLEGLYIASIRGCEYDTEYKLLIDFEATGETPEQAIENLEDKITI